MFKLYSGKVEIKEINLTFSSQVALLLQRNPPAGSWQFSDRHKNGTEAAFLVAFKRRLEAKAINVVERFQ